ncbi:PadR family transcriptional regulator [Hornefia butyriciproducens]|uniref:PadR family transcriptional regulator n=1 Tax=Hornefia butyriciproducens TaxID=2652293 RepID=UPI0023F1D136|nr:helix-turn-helix transcriptional regulator [Hornefia butyriciproducens]MDD6300055.1 helix-turn-helix transcriptional regulator [Hornefia butyriciproducens]
MSKKPLETLTETMFYVLMAFYRQEMCGTEIARYVRELTKGEVSMGPGTLYTILSQFQREDLIEKTGSEGRKITYAITERGRRMYQSELRRLRRCLADAEAAGAERGKL